MNGDNIHHLLSFIEIPALDYKSKQFIIAALLHNSDISR
jgi:hypothetical protein